MTREFVLDKKNLQREQKEGVPGYLTTLAYLVVLAIVAGILAALVIGLVRMDRDRARGAREAEDTRPGERPGAVAATEVTTA
jgi:hypothetical protein